MMRRDVVKTQRLLLLAVREMSNVSQNSSAWKNTEFVCLKSESLPRIGSFEQLDLKNQKTNRLIMYVIHSSLA